MRKSIVLLFLLVLASFILLGCTTIEKPQAKGVECNDDACFATNFLTCESAFGELTPDGENTFYGQIIGEEDDKCKVYIEVVEAKTSPVPITGLNAICKVAPEELAKLTDISQVITLDCYGPLFEAIKAYTSLQQ